MPKKIRKKIRYADVVRYKDGSYYSYTSHKKLTGAYGKRVFNWYEKHPRQRAKEFKYVVRGHIPEFEKAQMVYYEPKKTITELREKMPVPEEELPPLEMMYRLTLSVNYALHYDYYSFMLFAYARTQSELENKADDYEDELIKELEKHLHQPKENWWFSWDISKGFDTMMTQEDLIGTTEIKDERVVSGKKVSHHKYKGKKRMY